MIELETIKTLLKKHQTVFKQKYRIKQLGIFGSYVRGEATRDSDLDILVEFQYCPYSSIPIGLYIHDSP